MAAVDQVAAVLASSAIDPAISYKDSIINLCQHLKVCLFSGLKHAALPTVNNKIALLALIYPYA